MEKFLVLMKMLREVPAEAHLGHVDVLWFSKLRWSHALVSASIDFIALVFVSISSVSLCSLGLESFVAQYKISQLFCLCCCLSSGNLYESNATPRQLMLTWNLLTTTFCYLGFQTTFSGVEFQQFYWLGMIVQSHIAQIFGTNARKLWSRNDVCCSSFCVQMGVEPEKDPKLLT
jgi:hypothetical protein